MREEELLFVLDIGTRSVTGVVGKASGGTLEVVQAETIEHSERAVVDGQIEDIAQTAKVAAEVKERLEAAAGRQLRDVHVAAAGRVLKTVRASHEMELDGKTPIGPKQVLTLESQTVQEAYERLADELEGAELSSFSCVGYSPTGYTLDGYSFSTLAGHRGRRAGMELIATFLPNEVVESLYTTMSLVGLNIASMTLEPIAAMNAVIPQELRLLNIALVDVGAGTSDIAVSNNGSVCGYTMATVAGDEITERVMREFLVDFQTAERMKFQAGEERGTIDYTDILGLAYTVGAPEFIERVRPAVEELAAGIAAGILDVNGGAPMAVFLVGGGSRTPELCALVAEALGIDRRKVAVGGNNYMKRLVSADPRYLSAEYATPIGIAVTAMSAAGREGVSVTLNGERVQLLDGGSMSVLEVLLRGGYQYGQIMGRSGKSMAVEVDGRKRTVRGELPTLARVEVNGSPAGLNTILKPGDEVRFVPAVNGTDAAPRLKDVVRPFEAFEVDFLGKRRRAGTLAWVNGQPADAEQPLAPVDRVRVERIETLRELMEAAGYQGTPPGFLINGLPTIGAEHRLRPGDRIAPLPVEPRPGPAAGEAPDAREAGALRPPAAIQRLRVVVNGRERTLLPKADGAPYQFFDILNYVDIDPTKPEGDIVLRRNGAPASYLEPIQQDDRIEIFWASK